MEKQELIQDGHVVIHLKKDLNGEITGMTGRIAQGTPFKWGGVGDRYWVCRLSGVATPVTMDFILPVPANDHNQMLTDALLKMATDNIRGLMMDFAPGQKVEFLTQLAVQVQNVIDETNAIPFEKQIAGFIQYGPKWEAEIGKHPKKELIKIIKGLLIKQNHEQK